MLTRMIKLAMWFLAALVVAGTMMSLHDRIKGGSKETFQTPRATVYLFHAHWCGHCVEFRKSNVFPQVAAKVKNVAFVEIDVDKRKDLVKKYDVTSFPTIIGVVEGSDRKYEFEGDRYDAKQLESFAQKMLDVAT